MDSVQPEILYCAECGRPTPAGDLARFGDLRVCPVCKDIFTQKLREGVAPAVKLRYAGFWIRLLAAIIDGIIENLLSGIVQFVLLGSFVTQFSSERLLTEAAVRIALSSLVAVALSACYEAFFIAQLGATPGKLALGLKVVRADGGPVSLGRAFGRYFAKLLNIMTLFIGYIMAGFDSQKRGLHDMICDTRVIRARDI